MKSHLARHPFDSNFKFFHNYSFICCFESPFLSSTHHQILYDLLPSISIDVWNVYDSFELNVIQYQINKCVLFHKICPIDFNVCFGVWLVMLLLHFIAFAACSNYIFLSYSKCWRLAVMLNTQFVNLCDGLVLIELMEWKKTSKFLSQLTCYIRSFTVSSLSIPDKSKCGDVMRIRFIN